MSKYQRDKGKRGEYEVSDILKRIFPEAKRHLEFQGQEAKGYDIDNTGALRVQVKNHARYVNPSIIEEVKESGIPVLCTKATRKKWIACLYLDDFIKILSDIGIVYETKP